MKKSTISMIVGASVLFIGGMGYLAWLDYQPGKLDGFATCLKEKGAVFYGAFWCPHCQNQKQMFGRSAKKLPYVECSTPDGKGVLPVCQEKLIDGYPTWTFADGSRQSGEVPLATLAQKTSCTLPE